MRTFFFSSPINHVQAKSNPLHVGTQVFSSPAVSAPIEKVFRYGGIWNLGKAKACSMAHVYEMQHLHVTVCNLRSLCCFSLYLTCKTHLFLCYLDFLRQLKTDVNFPVDRVSACALIS